MMEFLFGLIIGGLVGLSIGSLVGLLGVLMALDRVDHWHRIACREMYYSRTTE